MYILSHSFNSLLHRSCHAFVGVFPGGSRRFKSYSYKQLLALQPSEVNSDVLLARACFLR